MNIEVNNNSLEKETGTSPLFSENAPLPPAGAKDLKDAAMAVKDWLKEGLDKEQIKVRLEGWIKGRQRIRESVPQAQSPQISTPQSSPAML